MTWFLLCAACTAAVSGVVMLIMGQLQSLGLRGHRQSHLPTSLTEAWHGARRR
jgi:hypothetical protein